MVVNNAVDISHVSVRGVLSKYADRTYLSTDGRHPQLQLNIGTGDNQRGNFASCLCGMMAALTIEIESRNIRAPSKIPSIKPCLWVADLQNRAVCYPYRSVATPGMNAEPDIEKASVITHIHVEARAVAEHDVSRQPVNLAHGHAKVAPRVKLPGEFRTLRFV